MPSHYEADSVPFVSVKRDATDKFATSLVASIIASLATLNFGFAMGYSSPTEEKMTDQGVFTQEEFSWFGVSI